MGLTEHCICLRRALSALMEFDGHRHTISVDFTRENAVYLFWNGGLAVPSCFFGVVGRNQGGKSGTWDGFVVFGERLSYGWAQISRG
jgi:hypothetical protein